MGHYFCVAITEEPKFSSVCNLLDNFVFDNDADESDGIFDYYTFNYHPDDRVAVKHGSRGYVATPDETDFVIGTDRCDCARAGDIDWNKTPINLPYFCFMPDGCYWNWEVADSVAQEQWEETKQQAIKNGEYKDLYNTDDEHLLQNLEEVIQEQLGDEVVEMLYNLINSIRDGVQDDLYYIQEPLDELGALCDCVKEEVETAKKLSRQKLLGQLYDMKFLITKVNDSKSDMFFRFEERI